MNSQPKETTTQDIVLDYKTIYKLITQHKHYRTRYNAYQTHPIAQNSRKKENYSARQATQCKHISIAHTTRTIDHHTAKTRPTTPHKHKQAILEITIHDKHKPKQCSKKFTTPFKKRTILTKTEESSPFVNSEQQSKYFANNIRPLTESISSKSILILGKANSPCNQNSKVVISNSMPTDITPIISKDKQAGTKTGYNTPIEKSPVPILKMKKEPLRINITIDSHCKRLKPRHWIYEYIRREEQDILCHTDTQKML